MTAKRRAPSPSVDGPRAADASVAARRRPPWLPVVLLVLLPLATFWPVLQSQFVNYDDPEYVVFNEPVRAGLSWEGVKWAFTSGHAANWHPMTWLSHMADVSLFGMNPAGHHATSLVLHVTNTVLLFLFLRTLTGRSGRSAWVAALFALHPAHVESFAWVAERKDVLSTAFGFGAMWAYVVWVRERGVFRYLLVLGLFAAGLMAKPMLVSIPILLLLVDDWPLDRFRRTERSAFARAAVLVREKTLLVLLAAASSAVTFFVQRLGGAVRISEYSLEARVENAIVAYVRYLRMLVWPAELAVFYPHPGESFTFPTVVGAALLLAGVTAGVIVLRRRAPYLFFGWAWFVVSLAPVIGLVQVGKQALADRYTYVPYVGLFVAIAWGAAAILGGRRLVLRIAAVATVAAATLLAAAQVRVWKDSERLLLHALESTRDNQVALNNLGDHYNSVNRPADALPHLLEAQRLSPTDFSVHVNVGRSLYLLGRLDEAEKAFSEALRRKPTDAVAQNNLARVYFVQGRLEESIRHYRVAVVAAPEQSEPRKRLAIALLMRGDGDAAIDQLAVAAASQPSSGELRALLAGAREFRRSPNDPAAAAFRRALAESHREISASLQAQGNPAEAKVHLRRAAALFPNDRATHMDLGAILAQEQRWDEAEAEFRRALEIDPQSALGHSNLGYVLHRKGRWDEGIAHYEEALRLQPGFPLARNNLDQALAERRARSERR